MWAYEKVDLTLVGFFPFVIWIFFHLTQFRCIIFFNKIENEFELKMKIFALTKSVGPPAVKHSFPGWAFCIVLTKKVEVECYSLMKIHSCIHELAFRCVKNCWCHMLCLCNYCSSPCTYENTIDINTVSLMDMWSFCCTHKRYWTSSQIIFLGDTLVWL